MGGTNWSDQHYDDRVKLRATVARDAGISPRDAAFGHDHAVKTGKAKAGVHPTLDPRGVKFRESRDSDVHPEAVPVAALLDVTGSMQQVPVTIQADLKKLLGLLIRKGYLEHPAILIGAIGDATSDTTPLQVGQFESGIEIEDNLTNLYLEGEGGGQMTESYELALYFMARHTVHDHHEKRGLKGYVFAIGDEMPYPLVKRSEVEEIIGERIERDIPVKDIVAEVKEKYHLYYIIPRMTSNFDNTQVRNTWRELVGENVILLDDPGAICECIATQIGLVEGKIDSPDAAEEDLVEAGTSRKTARAVSRALVPVGAETPRGGVQKVPDSGKPSGLAKF
jgi:hypothetical protein